MNRRVFAAALLAAPLAACATSSLVTAGPLAIGKDYQVTLGGDWGDISGWMAQRPKTVRLLSTDGPMLNRLYLTEGLAPGDFIVRPKSADQPTPTYRAGMSARERVEFVTDSIAALGYLEPEAVALRPAKFGQADGVRFDVTTKTEEGLEIAGAALVAERGGKLYLMLFLAPQEHYFGAGLPEVEKVFASATLPA